MEHIVSQYVPPTSLRAGDAIEAGFRGVCFVCYVDGGTIAYLDKAGEYHECTARDEYKRFLVHPAIGAHRKVEASAIAWAE